MTRSLWVHDLRSFAPVGALSVAWHLLYPLSAMHGSFVDLLPFPEAVAFLEPERMAAVATADAVLAFAVGSRLLMQPRDSGALTFLDGLPLTRGAILRSRMLAALAALGLGPFAQALAGLALHQLSATSAHGPVPLTAWAVPAAALVALMALWLCIGMLLGFLHRASWLVVVLCVYARDELEDRLPWLDIVDPIDVVDLTWVGASPRLSSPRLLVMAAFAAICLAGASWLFSPRGDRLADLVDRVGGHPLVRLALGAAFAVAVGAWLAFATSEDVLESSPPLLGLPPPRITTEHLVLTYRPERDLVAHGVMDEAELIHQRVAELLGATRVDITLDGTQALRAHGRAGEASTRHIRLDLSGRKGRVLDTLAHELAHVYVHEVSGIRERFLHEGIAEIVAERVRPHHHELEAHWQQAALLSASRDLRLDVLLDNDATLRFLSEDAFYSCGSTFLDTLVQMHGPQILKQVLHARPSAPGGSDRKVTWAYAFAAAGADLFAVEAAWRARLEAMQPSLGAAPELAQVLYAIPELENHRVRVRSAVEADVVGCVVRRGASTDIDDRRAVAFVDGACEVPPELLTGVRSQVALEATVDGVVVRGPWTDLPAGARSRAGVSCTRK